MNKKRTIGIAVIILIIAAIPFYFSKAYFIKRNINIILDEIQVDINSKKFENILKYLSENYLNERKTSKQKIKIQIEKNKRFFNSVKINIFKKNFTIVNNKKTELNFIVLTKYNLINYGEFSELKKVNLKFIFENNKWKIIYSKIDKVKIKK